MELLHVQNVSKIYEGNVSYRALSDITFSVPKGEFVGIMGPSGSGKTTLLNLLSTIDTPTSGDVLINGSNPYHLRKNKLAVFRRRNLGFVFQDFNLLDTLTLAENIVLPLTLDRHNVRDMQTKLHEIAERLNITDILNKRTFEVSGGQRQRAAIARAVIHRPSLLLADEPTGALDSKSSKSVMEAMATMNRSEGTTTLLVTHDPLAASYCHRVLFLKDGQLINEIHRGASRQTFFQEILNMLSFLGGDAHEFSAVRL
ncbi:putative ABC transport system ATP-binding protein [Tumebacillus sp. BK434]|uniref:ABC transporter ATP-binding protein n=1 Tax=Tumebacillus sp. BK434 TaxID=2512169 RepID=UPI00104DB3B8|nr:ABC transporter ATP-binding protein [Tumebacillus sp. BK434]TCP57960.1 putative ABC transport system ATP-binding protein [Tumebacillus sp. BK434]